MVDAFVQNPGIEKLYSDSENQKFQDLIISIKSRLIKSTYARQNNGSSGTDNAIVKCRLQIQNKEQQLRRGIHRPRESGLYPASRLPLLARAVFYRFAGAAWCLCDT